MVGLQFLSPVISLDLQVEYTCTNKAFYVVQWEVWWNNLHSNLYLQS
jgi:hypothetical protein